MAAKLDEKPRAEIIAAYAEGGISYQELGKRYGVSHKTIERAIKADSVGLSKRVQDIKKQNAVDVTEHIRSRSGMAMDLFDDTLAQLRKKLPNASVRELFGGLKIISEIFSPQADAGGGSGAEPVSINVIFGDTSGDGGVPSPTESISSEEAKRYAE